MSQIFVTKLLLRTEFFFKFSQRSRIIIIIHNNDNVDKFVTGIRYVIRLMEWIDDMITDEKIFPPVDDIPFPRYQVHMHCRYLTLCVFKTIDILPFAFSATLKMCAKRSSAVCIGSLSMSTLSTSKGAANLISEIFFGPSLSDHLSLDRKSA